MTELATDDQFRPRNDVSSTCSRNRLDTGRDAGVLPDRTGTAATALALTCTVERSIDVYFATASPLDPQQLARALGRIIWLSVSPQT